MSREVCLASIEQCRLIPHFALMAFLCASRSDPENVHPCLLYMKNLICFLYTSHDYSQTESIFSLLYKEEKPLSLMEVNLHVTFSMESARYVC